MADFLKYWPKLVEVEGYWANDLEDRGGATWMGISYNNYPAWSGWAVIESALPDFKHATAKIANPILKPNSDLLNKVQTFYKKSQWDVLNADQITNQSIASFLVDWGINTGMSIPAKKVQKILGLKEDGDVGPKTIAAINAANGPDLFAKLQAARETYYRAIVEAHPSDAKFLSTWLARNKSFSYSA